MVHSDSPEEGEIVDLTGIDDEEARHHAGTSNHNVDAAPRPILAARAPLNRRQRAPAPTNRHGRQQRRRSRSRSWSRSRSRSPIATAKKVTQNGGGLKKVDVPTKEQQADEQQQLKGSREIEKRQQQGHVLSPTEKRIEETAKKEAQNQLNVDKLTYQSPSGHNTVVDNLLSAGKLCLVLDLDHTLLHSVMFSELDPKVDTWLQGRAEADAALQQQEKRMLFRISGMQMYTKLRPGVREFLRRTAEKFELWIHTNGNLAYASAVIPFLDPTGSLFGGRIIAQGAERPEDMRVDQPKALEHGLEARQSISIVVDDSFAVWQGHASSLIMVERYLYFPSHRHVIKGASLLENQKDEDMKLGMLMITLELLEKMHAEVFKALKSTSASTKKGGSSGGVDVRRVLTENRKKVLKGVNLVFSRVIPLEQDPKTHELWKMAEAFGACCSAVLQPGVTTHLVAGDGRTEKVSAARAQGIAVVSPMWLRGCCLLWKRLGEKEYAVR